MPVMACPVAWPPRACSCQEDAAGLWSSPLSLPSAPLVPHCCPSTPSTLQKPRPATSPFLQRRRPLGDAPHQQDRRGSLPSPVATPVRPCRRSYPLGAQIPPSSSPPAATLPARRPPQPRHDARRSQTPHPLAPVPRPRAYPQLCKSHRPAVPARNPYDAPSVVSPCHGLLARHLAVSSRPVPHPV